MLTISNNIVQGVALICDQPSPYTQRVYPQHVIDDALAEFVKSSEPKLGELRFDGGPDKIAIGLKDVSHRIVDVKIIDGAVTVSAQVLKTPKGEELRKSDLSQLRFALRSIGETNPKGDVVTILQILTIDIIPI
jgi:hypothetical protein